MNTFAAVSAPGKLILMGEHAVVYGCPAIVVAVGPRTKVEIIRGGAAVAIELPDLDYRGTTTWDEMRNHARYMRAAWDRYAASPSREGFELLRSSSPGHLVHLSLGELALHLGRDRLPALRVRVESALPVGSGFGSSAAVAVAVIGACAALIGDDLQPTEIDRLTLQVERRVHGLPSGVDHKTILQGGLVRAERIQGDELHVSALAESSPVLERLEVLHTGRPVETTGEVVAKVKALRDGAPEEFATWLNRMRNDVQEFSRQLLEAVPSRTEVARRIVDYERCLENLGVVPEPVVRSIRAIERAGGAAKISGAGALSGDSAGCLVVYWPAGVPSSRPAELSPYTVQEVELGSPGLRVERIA